MNPTPSSQMFSHKIHVLVGGSGTTVILLSGWPETAEAYGDVFPLLAERHRVLAIDPPGLGESAPSNKGYDTAKISRILKESLSAEAGKSYHLVGHDIGAWMAYAWASQFPEDALPELPEILTQGRERELFDWLFEKKAETPRTTHTDETRSVREVLLEVRRNESGVRLLPRCCPKCGAKRRLQQDQAHHARAGARREECGWKSSPEVDGINCY